MDNQIENKVAKSGLVTIDLEELKPNWQIASFDLANVLWEGLVLKEKDFRQFVSEHDWSEFTGKHVYVHCSVDAIVPTWAYMLIAHALLNHAESAIAGSREDMELMLWRKVIESVNADQYVAKRVVIKGCSDNAIPETVYLELTQRLIPRVKSLMFGEPCSTVPVFKNK